MAEHRSQAPASNAALFLAEHFVDFEGCLAKWSETERPHRPVNAFFESFCSTSGNQGTSTGFHGGDRSKRLEADAHGASTLLPHRPCPVGHSRSKIALSKQTRVGSRLTPTLASTPCRFPPSRYWRRPPVAGSKRFVVGQLRMALYNSG